MAADAAAAPVLPARQGQPWGTQHKPDSQAGPQHTLPRGGWLRGGSLQLSNSKRWVSPLLAPLGAVPKDPFPSAQPASRPAMPCTRTRGWVLSDTSSSVQACWVYSPKAVPPWGTCCHPPHPKCLLAIPTVTPAHMPCLLPCTRSRPAFPCPALPAAEHRFPARLRQPAQSSRHHNHIR